MLTKPIRISCCSDIHLGNKRTSAASIISNLNKHISNDEHLSGIDLLILAGDVFDDLLSLSSEDVQHIDSWIARVLRLCKKHNVVVRVLEGTPSHDRGQSERFTIINEIHELNSKSHIDLKHIKELLIEFLPQFGINVLYVPDEWSHTTEDTLEQVKALLLEKNLIEVDFAIMHGNFHYQLPAHIKNIPRHSEEEYLAIVKYLIFIGHIHIHTRYERIIAQGSFDRLSMGEEGPKGFVTATVHPNGDNEVTFIENIGAKKHITVRCPYPEVDENIKLIDRAVEQLPPASYVRIEANKTNAILTNVDTIRARWPLLIWTSLVKDKELKEETSIISDSDLYVAIAIDKHNLVDLMMSRLTKLNLDTSCLQRCASNLTEMQRL